MRTELAHFSISDRELEQITGWDVGRLFIGGVLGGTYRVSALQNPHYLWAFCFTEVIVFLLIVGFTLPLSLFLAAGSQGISDGASTLRFLGIALSLAIAVFLSWNGYMQWRGKQLRRLMRLLDAVDRYEEMVQAIALFDQLETVNRENISDASLQNESEILEALQLTRDSLIAGLMTERILRENRGLLSRQTDLLSHIETNLAFVRSLEVKHQADEYGAVLSEALHIGMSVQREVQRLNPNNSLPLNQ